MLKPITERAETDAGAFCPVRYDQSLAVMVKPHIPARVPALSMPGRPDYVSRSVAIIIINSFDGVLRRWTRPHVGSKRQRVVQPFVSQSDAATAVTIVARIARITAPRSYGRPQSVKRRASHPVDLPRRTRLFSVKAPATRGAATSKIAQKRGLSVAAITQTFPLRRGAPVHAPNCYQATVSLAGHVERGVCGHFEAAYYIAPRGDVNKVPA